MSNSETPEQRAAREAGSQLGLMLAQHLWDKYDPFRLGGEEFEVVGCDDVPGHEDEEYGVFLRRNSDGKIFEAEIVVDINPAEVKA